MAKKVKFGQTYLTKFGTEFTPIRYIKGKLKYKFIDAFTNPDQRLEGRFEDANGKRIKTSNLLKLKQSSN